MKQFKQSFKSLLATMALLCMSMTAMADGESVEIDGVFTLYKMVGQIIIGIQTGITKVGIIMNGLLW